MTRWLLPVVLLALLPASASAAPLAHTSWRVARIGRHDVSSTHQRLRFFSRDGFTGHKAGCGGSDFGGHYQAAGTELLFKDVHVTGEGCDEAGKQPPSILTAIFETRFYGLHGRKLELLGRRGHRLAVLKRR